MLLKGPKWEGIDEEVDSMIENMDKAHGITGNAWTDEARAAALEARIHHHLQVEPRSSLSSLQKKFGGGQKVDKQDPLSHPVNAALKSLRDKGKVEVHGGDWGEPSFSAIHSGHGSKPEHFEVGMKVKDGGLDDPGNNIGTVVKVSPHSVHVHYPDGDPDFPISYSKSDLKYKGLGILPKTHNAEKEDENTRTLLLEWIAEMVANKDYEAAHNATEALKDPERIREITRNLAMVENEFCPTGAGGGVDPTCSPHARGGGPIGERIRTEPKTPPPPGYVYTPDVEKTDADGITGYARIGVPAMSVPPPPSIPPLPNLTPAERKVETDFIDHYQKNPDKIAADFRSVCIIKGAAKGDPPTFGTDDAKELSPDWNREDLKERSQNRATLNCALHATANAICKRAFLQHLDSLNKGDEVLVTVGGCGAGKGYSLGKSPPVLAMKAGSKAVWDSAGDQNATENKWIQSECEKRGLKATYVFVHADPKEQWANPERGVVKRAGSPNDGRMVDAQVFADSYALGAKNHQAFYEKNKDNPNAKFVFLSNPPRKENDGLLPGIPKEALNIDRHELARFARETVRKSDAPPHVQRGALVGVRIWGVKND